MMAQKRLVLDLSHSGDHGLPSEHIMHAIV
jgi:hypothetical protein